MQIKNISSPSNPLIKTLRGLDVKKNRDQENLFLVEGERHIAEAVAAGWTPKYLLFSAVARDCPVLSTCIAAGTECIETTEEILQKVSHRDNAQDVVAFFSPRSLDLQRVSDGFWVMLEEVKDPGNLGTIMRTAEAAGCQGVILVGMTCDPWSPEAVRASMGTFCRVQLVRATVQGVLDWKSRWKGTLLGTHLKTEIDFRNVEYNLPLVVAMGSEQSGLSDALAAACDKRVRIPMMGDVESLNLGVSTGIMLYEAARGRLK
jgi:TrmH family RNA methyltransferase